MKHKSLICVLLSIILVIHLASCSIAPMKQKKNIAVIVKSEHSSFWQMVEKGVNAAATEYNVNFSFEGPLNEEDFEKQNQMIMNAVDRSVDAIVLSAIDYEKCAKAVTIAPQKKLTFLHPVSLRPKQTMDMGDGCPGFRLSYEMKQHTLASCDT